MKCFEFDIFPCDIFIPRSSISLERSNEYFLRVGDEKVVVSSELVKIPGPPVPYRPGYDYILPEAGNARRINGQLWLDNSNPVNVGQVATESAALVHVKIANISNATVQVEIAELAQAPVISGGTDKFSLLMILPQRVEVRFKKTIATRELLRKKWWSRERYKTTTTSAVEYLLFDGIDLRLYSELQRVDLKAQSAAS